MRVGVLIQTAGVVLVCGIQAAVLTACSARPSPLDEAAWTQITSSETRARRLDAVRPPPPGPTMEIGQPATAEAYAALALARHPAIRAGEAKVRRLAERPAQVRSLDDPMLMLAPVGEMAETAAGRVRLMGSLSQRVPLTEKLITRSRIAELEASQAEAELRSLRLKIAGDARRAYWMYAFATQAIETTRRSRALLEQFRDVADAQFRAGNRPQQDVLRASAELGNIDARLAELEQRRASAQAMLRQLINAPADSTLPPPAQFDYDQIELERLALLERALQANPALLRAAERMEQYRQTHHLAELNRVPDLTVSLSYTMVDDDGLSPVASGRDQWWIGLGFNIPIWAEKYDAAEREALFGRLEAAFELDRERTSVTFEVEDALARLDAQQQTLRVLREQIVPDARAAVEASASTYRAGSGDFLTLIDNWRTQLGYELMEHSAVANAGRALADLKQAIGQEGEP